MDLWSVGFCVGVIIIIHWTWAVLLKNYQRDLQQTFNQLWFLFHVFLCLVQEWWICSSNTRCCCFGCSFSNVLVSLARISRVCGQNCIL